MPRDTVIPNVTFPPRARDQSGQVAPPFTQSIALEQRRIQITGAARDAVVPIIYGGWERTGGLLYTATVNSGNELVLAIILCEGTVEEIGTVQMNDADLPAGVTVTKYTGSQTTVNSTLAGAIPGFAETLAGIAYLVVTVPQGASTGFPRFTALVKGRKVLDPRTGLTVFSDNPALILADFLSSTVYGARKTVNAASVIEAANYCDDLIGSPAEKRCTLTMAITEKRPIMDWVDTLRAYVPCWICDNGAEVTLVVDKARSSDHTFTASNIDAEPAPKLKKRGVSDLPTVVEVGYTRTDVTPWTTAYAEATTGAARRRVARIEMPGIRRYGQALRFATERLNHYTLEDLEVELGVFEDGIKVREGDVVTVTDAIGITSKQFRVLEATDRGHGRWLLKGREYDPAAYSTVVATDPTTPDVNLPNPRVVPAVTGLAVTEDVYLEKVVAADSLSRGFIYQSRFRISWIASAYSYPKSYRIQLLDGGSVVYEGATTDVNHTTPPIQQNKLYTIRVYTRGDLGFESAFAETTSTAVGKNLVPGNVPAITSALEIGGEVLLSWSPAVDVDIVRYEWRYGATSGFTWAGSTLIDRVDGLRARFRGLPVGTWRFAVKAIDSVGQYSATETTTDITITADDAAFLQDQEFSSPTLTNMALIPQLEGQDASAWETRWATRVSSDAWNSVMPNPVNSGANPVISYHASATSKFQGESWDIGATVTGDWVILPDVTVLTGSVIYEVETSTNGSSWTTQAAGTSYKGSARYVRPVIRCATTSTIQINKPPKMTLIANSRRESNTTTSLASGAKTITLVNKYIKVNRVLVTPIGTTPKTATVDNIILSLTGSNTFDVYIFNDAGTQVASDFYWEFEGI